MESGAATPQAAVPLPLVQPNESFEQLVMTVVRTFGTSCLLMTVSYTPAGWTPPI
jgi:hypothetical protein